MLEYTLTTDDLAAFAAWQAAASGEERSRRPRLRATGAFLIGGGAYLAVFAVSTLPLLLARHWQPAGIAEAVAVLLGVVTGWVEWRRGRVAERLLTRRYRVPARAALARTGASRRVWLDVDGLHVAAGDRATQVPWAEITGVVESPEHLFVLTGSSAAHVIPCRVGADAVRELADGIRARVSG